MENEASLPRLIDNGQVDQTVVEYTGGRLGAVTYRGPSGRPYRFDAGPSNKRHYVLDEDLEYFRRLVDFRVLEERRIDPEADKLKGIEAAVGDRLVKEVTRLLRPDGAGKRKRAPRRRGGRPPVPVEELQRLWHLRHHCDPPWTIGDLATQFLDDSYFDPKSAVSARLFRFKKAHPELTGTEHCSLCVEGYHPDPPSSS